MTPTDANPARWWSPWRQGAIRCQVLAQRALRMIQYPILFLLLAFAVWCTLRLTVFICSLLVSPPEIMLVPFESGSDEQKNQGLALLSSKLREMQARGGETPTGYGFLSVPSLEATPRQAEQRPNALSVLDNIELKIKDVNVPAIIKAFDSAFTPVRYELHGDVADLPTVCVVSCKLMRHDDVVASWEASERVGATDDAAAKTARFERLLDEVLYQMVFDFANKPQFCEWSTLVRGGHRFNSWQSLRAYVRGLRALCDYQKNLNHDDLDDAIAFFEQLVVEAPDEHYGIYFLALARSENREEAEAISEFEQLQRLLARQPNPEPGTAQMLHEAKFNEAAARLKLYKQSEGDKALAGLAELIDTLKQTVEASPARPQEGPARNWRDRSRQAAGQANLEAARAQQKLAANTAPGARGALENELKQAQATANLAAADLQAAEAAVQQARRNTTRANIDTVKLLAISYAQLAYTYGTILSFFKEAGTPPGDYGQRIDDNLRLAKETAADLDGLWSSPRAAADVEFRILNAEGYALYRRAYFEAGKDRAKYQQLCKAAIGTLERSNSARPNHYEVLQNMGMIYADEDFDPDGNFLAEARRIFERTKKFVPHDYYQYEQLALVQWRWARDDQTVATAKPHIDAGTQEAARALVERPGSSLALALLARFARKSWEINDRADDASATAALKAFVEAAPANARDPDYRTECLAFFKALKDVRDKSAAGLNDLAARVIELAGRLRPSEGRGDFARFARGAVEKSLDLTKGYANDPTLVPLHDRAAELAKQVDDLLAVTP